MVGRLAEGLYVLGRLVWFYKQAPKKMTGVGFHPTEEISFKARAKWAWLKTNNQI